MAFFRKIKFVFLSLLVLFPTIILPTFASYHQTTNIQNESLKNKKISYKEIRKRKHSKNKSNLKNQVASSNLSVPTNGLVLYLDAMSIDGNNTFATPVAQNRTFSDLSGNGNNGTLTNVSLPFASNSGWTGGNTAIADPSALRFDGANDYIDAGSGASLDFSNTSQFTIQAWIKTSYTSSHHFIASKWISGKGYFLSAYDGVPGQSRLLIQVQTNGSNYIYAYGNTNLGDGAWHHVVGTYAGTGITSGLKLFVDGVEQTYTSGISGSIGSINNTTSLKIGRRDDGYFFNGSIANVRIYNRALSADEIAQSYLAEKDYFGSTPVVVSSNKVLDLDASNYDNAGTTASSSTSTMTWTDRSGNNNNGTLTNFTLPTAGSASGWDLASTATNLTTSVLKFDGTDDYVQIANSSTLNPTGAISVSAWFKTLVANKQLVDKLSGGGGSYAGYRLQHAGSGRVSFGIGNSDFYTATDVSSTVDGNWHHVIGVYDGSTIKLYRDSVLRTTLTSVPTSIGSSASDLYVGAITSTNAFFSGNISNVRIYSTALSATQIQQNYLAEAPRFNNPPRKPAVASASRSSAQGVNPDTLVFTADYNEALNITFSCQDPDSSDTVTLSTTSTPQVGTFTAAAAGNSTTATYVYTPSESYINMNYSFGVRCTDDKGVLSPLLNIVVKGPTTYTYTPPVVPAPASTIQESSTSAVSQPPQTTSTVTPSPTPTATPAPIQNITNSGSSSSPQGTNISTPSVNSVPSPSINIPKPFIDVSMHGIVQPEIPKTTGIDISKYKPNVKLDSAPYIDLSKEGKI